MGRYKLPFNNEMFYNLKSLKITSNVNLDIKAYQKFPNLVEIDINYNKLLTDIKIKSFPNLIKLNASGTIITGDSIRKLEKIKKYILIIMNIFMMKILNI